jgi:hypothetical protein
VAKRLAASFVDLIHEATLKSHWRRKSLWRLLRQIGIAESFLATWTAEETKRDFLDRLFARLPEQTGDRTFSFRQRMTRRNRKPFRAACPNSWAFQYRHVRRKITKRSQIPLENAALHQKKD